MKADNSQIKSILKAKGFKVTPGRVHILEVIMSRHIPLSAEDIAVPHIDRATIYRTLAAFERAGILKKVNLNKDTDHFEMNDDHHHHIVCNDCGAIEDFETCDLQPSIKKILKASHFKTISTHSLELFGTCKKCA